MKLSNEQLSAIETALSAKLRVELIPTKDGVKVFKLTRKELK